MNTTFYTTAVWAEGTPSVNFFVAPKTGWYFLAASGTHDSGGTDGKAYQISLRVNGDITVGAGGVISGTMISTYVSTIVHLNKGDIVRPHVHIGEADDSFVFRGQWALLQIG